MPPEVLVELEGWMKRKNMEIEATNLIEGRQMLPQISSSAKRLAYYIKSTVLIFNKLAYLQYRTF